MTGASDISTDLVSSNQITDYSFITQPFKLDEHLAILRCASGLGPSGNERPVSLGGWYFGGIQLHIPTGRICNGPIFEVRGANARRYPGVINLYLCGTFTTTEEGVYSCIMMNSSMMKQTMRVGVYFSGRTAPMIDPPSSSTVTVVVGSPLTLSCTSRGSPPDTFTWRKDSGPILQSTSISTVTHTSTSAVLCADYYINSVTTSDSGTYTCNVTNPIGSDSETITVTATFGPPDNTRATVTSSRSIEVTWDQSQSTATTGYLISYTTTASYTSGGSVMVNGRSTTSVTLTNLEENTHYTITVQTDSSGTLSDNGDVVSVTTWTDVPSSPPHNVMVTSVNPSSLRVSWQPPLEIDHNGVITGYVIEYTKVESGDEANVTSGTTSRMLELDPFVDYAIRVAVMTVNGTGPFSNVIVQTSGEDVPSAPPRLLMVDGVTDSTVTLSWMTSPQPNGVATEYEVQYNIVNRSFTTHHFTGLTGEISGLISNTAYEFRIAAVTIEGHGPFTNDVITQKTDGPPANVAVTVLSSTSIRVTWNPLPALSLVTNYIISYDGVESFADDDSVIVGKSSTRAIINGLEEFVSYDITTQAVYSKRRGPLSIAVRVITLSDVPDGPPCEITLMDTDPAMLSVTYRPPLAINRNGDVTGYVIRYTSGVSQMITVYIEGDGRFRTSLIPGLVPFTNYSVQVAVVNVNGTGPFSDAAFRLSGQDRPATVPRSFTADVIHSTSVTLSWMPADTPNGIIIQYEVQYSVNSTTSLVNFTDSLMGTVEGLSPGTIYTLQIRAYTRVGAGPFSSMITLMTLSEPPTPVPRVTTQSISSSMLTINWMEPNVPNSVIDHYTVFYLPVSGPYGPIMTSNRRKRQLAQDREFAMDFPGTSGTLTNLNGSVTYRIQVSAIALNNIVGDRSDETVILTNQRTPTEPRDIISTNVTQSSIFLTWQRPDPPNGLIANYTVSYIAMVTYFNQTNGEMDIFTINNSTSVLADDNNISSSLNFTNLRHSTEYQFTIVAYTNVGPGPEAMISVSTLPDASPTPPTPQLSRAAGVSVEIKIQQAPDVNGHILYYAVIVVIGGDETSLGTTNIEDIGPFNKEEADTANSDGQPYTYITGIVEASDISGYPYPYIVGDESRSSIGGVNYENVQLQTNTTYAVLIRVYTSNDMFSTSEALPVTTVAIMNA
ncbi:receptor-type tyrosine-protein phosphatase F-like isoform X3 [Dysidea avara]|uniref:receptor-type tyrosine-protein phosphatase F-like isoform X3 n=1 Tax=Dysidea avara TaxID=196820 RepID=UPI00332A83EF